MANTNFESAALELALLLPPGLGPTHRQAPSPAASDYTGSPEQARVADRKPAPPPPRPSAIPGHPRGNSHFKPGV
jgi:hypothetical protein